MRWARRCALWAAAAFFLWMFMAAAPIEALADADGLRSLRGRDAGLDAYRFAADWRHGMAGNSPLYMPGFFALAVAAWFWLPRRPTWYSALEAGVILLLAIVPAWLGAVAAGPRVAAALEGVGDVRVVGAWPAAPLLSIVQGVYTAAAWSTGVSMCRLALITRSMRPLLVIPAVTAVLVMIRPWTVNDFVALWAARALEGNAAAVMSAFAIPVVGVGLALTERRPQWVHIHRSARRIEPDR